MAKQQTDVDLSEILPNAVKVEYLTGDTAFKAQQVAALTGIHPLILEMGRTLIDEPGKVARFKLATTELRENADKIQEQFLAGLRRVATALSKERLSTKGERDGDQLVFWYVKGWSHARLGE
jgi:hypothetical protein